MKHLLPFLCLLLAACGTKTNTEQTPADVKASMADAPPMGDYNVRVKLAKDTTQTYDRYIPTTYSDSVNLPVIIFFDPHGDGSIPVNMYKALAEESKYILIGSNNSQNGMSLEQTNAIANSLVTEVKTNYPASTRILFSGFSGGAKVAMLSGAKNKEVAGIIYAGAVAPVEPNHPVSLLGFAGTGDLNYSDEILFHKGLPATIDHYLVEWNGKHTWPDAETFRTAFTWPFSSIPKEKLATIGDRELGELMNEDNMKREIVKNLLDKDIDWWTKEIAELNAHKQNDVKVERLLGFISLACYTYGGQALKQNNIPVAEQILHIYSIADPNNADCRSMIVELNKRKVGMTR